MNRCLYVLAPLVLLASAPSAADEPNPLHRPPLNIPKGWITELPGIEEVLVGRVSSFEEGWRVGDLPALGITHSYTIMSDVDDGAAAVTDVRRSLGERGFVLRNDLVLGFWAVERGAVSVMIRSLPALEGSSGKNGAKEMLAFLVMVQDPQAPPKMRRFAKDLMGDIAGIGEASHGKLTSIKKVFLEDKVSVEATYALPAGPFSGAVWLRARRFKNEGEGVWKLQRGGSFVGVTIDETGLFVMIARDRNDSN
jgi:hypothetical protein